MDENLSEHGTFGGPHDWFFSSKLLTQTPLGSWLFLGAIDIVRTQLGEEGGSAKCLQTRTRDEGGGGY